MYLVLMSTYIDKMTYFTYAIKTQHKSNPYGKQFLRLLQVRQKF